VLEIASYPKGRNAASGGKDHERCIFSKHHDLEAANWLVMIYSRRWNMKADPSPVILFVMLGISTHSSSLRGTPRKPEVFGIYFAKEQGAPQSYFGPLRTFAEIRREYITVNALFISSEAIERQ
jgi:hypothetical protein